MASVAAAGGSEGENGTTHIAGFVGVCGGGWATERAELLALAKIAVSNGVVSLQVAKRLTATVGGGKGGGGGEGGGASQGGGRAVVEFGAHSQFPFVRVTFD